MILKSKAGYTPPDRALLDTGVAALTTAFASAKAYLKGKVTEPDGKIDPDAENTCQPLLHGLSYLACELFASRQIAEYAKSYKEGDLEYLIAAAFIASCVRRWAEGADLSGLEQTPAAEMGITPELAQKVLRTPEMQRLIANAGGTEILSAIAEIVEDRGSFGDMGIQEQLLREVQAQFQRFAEEVVVPIADEVHRSDSLIPLTIIAQLADQGVFGITIPEEYGGTNLGKTGMVIVTEELSRGYIGVGSLGTRAEIAAELILNAGTEEQKKKWLPSIASGEALPTAVFTEPNFGSDLANIRTRAERKASGKWVINGQKTWITHGARANLMTLLARSIPSQPGYRGLSMFLVPKTRGTDEKPFPDDHISGTPIPVIGYRGMKEYEIAFDDFEIPADSLLGTEEGKGFKQLMSTFESARIQTAARGVGLARAALELSFRYARERKQFGRPIYDFPRVHQKIAKMVVLTQAARQLTYYAAKMKESGFRCDLEAGMAKLLATKAAFLVADAGVQIHGGNGYAEEYAISRVFVDSRVLSIFEGANEIQAHVIARRLLEE